MVHYFINFYIKNNEDNIDRKSFIHILFSNEREADLNKPTDKNNNQ